LKINLSGLVMQSDEEKQVETKKDQHDSQHNKEAPNMHETPSIFNPNSYI
jgi:hypothetical protein